MGKILYCLIMLFVISQTSYRENVPAEDLVSEFVLEEERVTPAFKGGGYPRFESLDENTLLYFNNGYVYKSMDNAESWTRKPITENAAFTSVSSTGKTHGLWLENWQGFVMQDGTVMVSYRARTKEYTSGEFYTSIRVMTSTDGAETFGNEVVIAENTTNSFHGYWEPFMIQPDGDTLLLFYSDDLNVKRVGPQQNIVYHEYDISKSIWSEPYVAVNGVERNSRDGMPVITKLKDGGYAMVIETQDYHNRFYNGTFGKSVFVISISLSSDGRTWTEPVPVVAPTDIKGGDRCAAPYITTLADGRVVISYMTEDGFHGTRVGDEVLNCVYGAVVSTEAVTADTEFSPTKGGAADGFEHMPDIFEDPFNGYMIWNTVYFDGEYIYFAGSAGTNDGSVASSVRVRRAFVKGDSDTNSAGN